MIIQFRTGNYLSFNQPVNLSLLASSKVRELEENNIIHTDRYNLLRCAAIYGANASGKSNLLNALVFMRRFVINSSKDSQAKEPIGVDPFRLDVSTEKQPSFFEITILLDGYKYRYGFESDQNFIHREWLFQAKRIKETPLFLREDEVIDVDSSFGEGKGLEVKTRDNALFLSVVANFNGELSMRILEWFQNLRSIHGLYAGQYAHYGIEMLSNESDRKELIDFIRRADLGVQDFVVKEEDIDTSGAFRFITDEGRKKLPADLFTAKRVSISTVHNKYDGTKVFGTELMDFEKDESEGTRKFFRLAGPILQALREGAVVVADELEAKLHPLLTRAIVRLFLSPKTNPKNAQLIFATHDTHLLRDLHLRRDQIWFTEKTQQEATDLFSLAEIILPKGTKVRNDASYDKDYIQGKYGAIPYLGDFYALVEEMVNGETSKAD